MAGNFLYFSNYTEKLYSQLSKLLALPPTIEDTVESVLRKEIILIHSTGIERYLSLAIAQENSICSGVDFLFPAHFVKKLLGLGLGEPFPFDSQRTGWLIWKLLIESQAAQQKKSGQYRAAQCPAYMQAHLQNKSLQSYQFSHFMAKLFDRYLIHSPNLIRSWQANKRISPVPNPEEDWQARLWQNLIINYPDLAIHKHLDDFFASIADQYPKHKQTEKQRNREILNIERVFVFGAFSLPLLFQEILFSLSKYLDIHWFFLRAGPNSLSLEDNTNPLLRAYDQKKKKAEDIFFNLLHQQEASSNQQKRKICSQSFFVCPKASSLLGLVQQSLYQDTDLSKRQATPSAIVSKADRSIQIHRCHSPLREVEVLADFIIDQLQQNPQLEPEDILVMSPDPSTYAPLVEAVFANLTLTLPYSLADTFLATDLSFYETFFQLIDLALSRFTAPEIFTILSNQWIAKKAGFSPEDLEQIQEWLDVASIRWGIDADHQNSFNLPTATQHSLIQGLNRLFLSYAIPVNKEVERLEKQPPQQQQNTIASIRPVTDINPEQALLLGRFAELVECLADYANKLSNCYCLNQWALILTKMEEDLLGTNRMQATLTELDRIQREDGFGIEVDISVVRTYLESIICHSDHAKGRGFGSGGITFSALLPMRSVPHAVICLLGMNEGDFPRRETLYEFDICQEQGYKHGQSQDNEIPFSKQDSTSHSSLNTQRLQEDRLLFLEVLLCTREQFYISYVGQSSYRPHETFLPAIVVQELCDYLDNCGLTKKNESRLSEQITFWHRLQAFHHDYFTGDEKKQLFSYSRQSLISAQALTLGKEQGYLKPPDFCSDFHVSNEISLEKPKQLKLEKLLSFLKNSTKAWLKQRLDFRLQYSYRDTKLSSEEPLYLDNLDTYELVTRFVHGMLGYDLLLDQDNHNLANFTQSYSEDMYPKDLVPQGNFGQLLVEKAYSDALIFIESIKQQVGDRVTSQLYLPFCLQMDEHISLSGSLESWCTSKGDIVFFHYGEQKGYHLLRAWILHLLWQLIYPSQDWQQPSTHLITKKKYTKFEPFISVKSKEADNKQISLEHLKNLIAIYEHGIEQKQPPVFFCETSYAYIQSQIANSQTKKKSSPLAAALGKWEKSYYRSGESEEKHTKLCFGQKQPLKMGTKVFEDFESLSNQIFRPLLEHSIEKKNLL